MDINSSTPRKLPIGIQSFEKLRSEGFVYVDKTALVYKLAQAGVPCFLSRPRRFGKSLLLSTFEAYFKGKRELFHGLAIEQLEQNWYEYPVLHLSFNDKKYESKEQLSDMLESQFSIWEAAYGVTEINSSYSIRFTNLIRQAYQKTGRRTVVLIDDYDKPLFDSYDNPELQEEFSETLSSLYTVLKSADPWLQFLFITGRTKFTQSDPFSSGLNQLNDISFDLAYNTLCGLTLTEIETTFAPELDVMAKELDMNLETLMEDMTRQYGGYRFTSDRKFTPMYTPFSVLSALTKRCFGNYWFEDGMSAFLGEIQKKARFDLRKIDGYEVGGSSLNAYHVDADNLVGLMYQSGYVTIKECDERFGLYTLGFPNEEVKSGFLNS